MLRPRALALAAAAAAALAASGCGAHSEKLPTACVNDGERVLERALGGAPTTVRLPGGEAISTCVARARSDGDLQSVGAIWTAVAGRLMTSVPASDAAALRLGYLIGAARRGARHTSGIHVELVRRLEQTPGIDGVPSARRSAFARGLAAGTGSG